MLGKLVPTVYLLRKDDKTQEYDRDMSPSPSGNSCYPPSRVGDTWKWR